MSEENKPQQPQPPPSCERLADACKELKAAPDENKYRALLAALEADILEGRVAYLPIAKEDVEKLQASGEIKWSALKTPHGVMLALFTSSEESLRNGGDGSVAIPVGVFCHTMTQREEFAGIVLNPFDGGGIVLPKAHVGQVLAHVQQRSMRLDQPVVVDALWRLWDCAEGVPFPYKDVRDEVAELGGVDRIMGPVMLAWKKRFDAGEFKDGDPLAVMKDMATDVLRHALAAAAGEKVRPGLFEKQTPYEWLKEDVVEADGETLEEETWLFIDGADPAPEKVAKLREDVKKNVAAYMDLLSANLKAQGLVKTDADLGPSMLANAGPVCFGLMSFGVGWGTALYLESRGPEAVQAARERQEKLLAAVKK